MGEHVETVFLSTGRASETVLTESFSIPNTTEVKWERRRWTTGDHAQITIPNGSNTITKDLIWSFNPQQDKTIFLTDVNLEGQVEGSLRLTFPSRIFPKAVFAVRDSSVFLFTLDCRGALWWVEIAGGSDASELANLSKLGAENCRATFIGDKVASPDAVTCFAAGSGCICIGTASGSIIVLPIEHIREDSRVPHIQLRDPLWPVQKFLNSVLLGGGAGAVISAVPIANLGDRGIDLLAVLYENGRMNLWDINNKLVLASQVLNSHAEMDGATIATGLLPCKPGTDLVAQFEYTNDAQKRSMLLVIGLEFKDGTNKIEITTAPLIPSISGGTMVMGCTFQEGEYWVCLRGIDGRSTIAVVGSGHLPETEGWQGIATLLEMNPVVQMICTHGTESLERQAGLWQALHANLPGLPPVDLAKYAFSKLLDIGPLCPYALENALRKHGTTLTDSDWASANSGHLAGVLNTTARKIQAKHPAFLQPYCYYIILRDYYINWAALHEPVGFAATTDGRGWFAIRGGGVLSVIRYGKSLETLFADVKEVNGGQGETDLVILTKAALFLGFEFGTLFMDACSAVLMNGGHAMLQVIPAAVKTFVEGGGVGGFNERVSDWRSHRRQIQFHLLQRLEALNDDLGVTLGKLFSMAIADTGNREFNCDMGGSKCSPGVVDFTVNTSRQISACETHVFSCVSLLLGLMFDGHLGRQRATGWGTPIVNGGVLSAWVGAGAVYGLTAVPSLSTGKKVHNLDAMDVDPVSSSSLVGGHTDAFVSAAHFLASQYLPIRPQREDNFGEMLNNVGMEFDAFAKGADRDCQKFGDTMTLRLFQFVTKLFGCGNWKAVQFLDASTASLAGDVGQMLISSLAMATLLKENRDMYADAEDRMVHRVLDGVGMVEDKSYPDESLTNVLTVLGCYLTKTFPSAGVPPQLVYLEAMILAYAHVGAHKAASQLAKAALHHVHIFDLLPDHKKTLTDHLWEQIFDYSIASSNFSLAFSSLTSNPDLGETRTKLRTLVTTMCTAGHIKELLSLPFVGRVFTRSDQGDGDWGLVKMKEEVLHALHDLAKSVPIETCPQPYWVLYAWHIRAGDHQKAAGSLVAFAHSIKAHSLHRPGALLEMHEALVFAVTCLELVPEADAWVSDSLPAGDTYHVAVRLHEVRRECTLIGAYCKILEHHDKDSCTAIPPPKVIFNELLSLGEYEDALTVASVVFEGHELTSSCKLIVSDMAEECIDRLERPDEGGNADGCGALPREHCCWFQLQDCLEKYDTQQHGFSLRLAAAETILKRNASIRLPQWLINMIKEGDGVEGWGKRPGAPNVLVTLLVKYGRLQDALDVILDEISNVINGDHLDVHDPSKQQQVWVPYHLVVMVRNKLIENGDMEGVNVLDGHIQELAQKHRLLGDVLQFV